jgi:DNA-binding transcriptional regulator LsrR (DeoR family)
MNYQNEDLMMRAAWLYFIEELTQEEIGNLLGLSRLKVLRLISRAREENKVHIEISHPIVRCLEMEKRLKKIFNLKDVVVVPKPYNPEDLKLFLGKGAAALLDRIIRDGQSLAVGWGTTLFHTVRFIKGKTLPHLKIISISGGVSRQGKENIYEIARTLATKLEAQCYYISAPTFVDSIKSKNVVVSQKNISDTLEIARDTDFVLVGIGAVGPQASLVKTGFLKEQDIKHLQELGAEGEIIGHFVDKNGEIVDQSYSDRVIGLSLSDLKKAKCPMGIAGGSKKIKAIKAVLKNCLIKMLVTDEETAENLIRDRYRQRTRNK